MPPVRELAWQLGITPGTVARAYKLAAEEGLVETGVGRGTFVSGGLKTDTAPPAPLISNDRADELDFRATRVPDTGQGAVIRRVMEALARSGALDLTDYPDDRAAREAVTHWVSEARVGRFGPEDVAMSLGAQNALNIVLQSTLHGANPVILTEELAYPGIRHAARLLRARLIGLEMDGDGIRPDRLEEALRRHGGQVLVTSAEVHSPTTLRTTVDRRMEIARIARQYQLQILEDDCHCITRQEAPGYRAICPERAWYVSALTKSVSAALRFGFIIAPREQAAVARQVVQSSFYGPPQPAMAIATELLRSGEAETIRAATEEAVKRRVQRAVNILGRWDIRWREDAPFLWLRLPQGWRASRFDRACAEAGIRIKPADEFALADGQAPHAVRLTLNSSVAQPRAEAALERISRLLGRPPVEVDSGG